MTILFELAGGGYEKVGRCGQKVDRPDSLIILAL